MGLITGSRRALSEFERGAESGQLLEVGESIGGLAKGILGSPDPGDEVIAAALPTCPHAAGWTAMTGLGAASP